MINYSAEYVVKEFHVSDTKNGNKMGKLLLEDIKSKEVLNCVLWQEAIDNNDPKALRTGNTVRIISGEYKEQFNNVNVRELELLEEAPVGIELEDREKLFNNIFKIISSFKDQNLRDSISKIIIENKELFKVTPAAKSVHHNYVGGLMQHIWECIDFAQVLFPRFRQDINNETILAACIMHDIGKMFEYEIDLETGIVKYNENFEKEWISHTQYAYSWAMNNDFKDLARIIAAHHGRKDWGALIDLDKNFNTSTKEPEPVEYLMHHIDDLSAKFGMIGVEQLERVSK